MTTNPEGLHVSMHIPHGLQASLQLLPTSQAYICCQALVSQSALQKEGHRLYNLLTSLFTSHLGVSHIFEKMNSVSIVQTKQHIVSSVQAAISVNW